MRYLTAALLVISTGLWLGGLVTLGLLVGAVFTASGLDRPIAGRATSVMFVWFGRYQLAVGVVALLSAFLAYVLHGRRDRRVATALFVVVALASLGAVAFNMYYVPRIEGLRLTGASQSPEFRSLHKQSETLVKGVVAVVLVAAVLLPAVCRTLFAPKPVEPPRDAD